MFHVVTPINVLGHLLIEKSTIKYVDRYETAFKYITRAIVQGGILCD
jgi:hypothetical protein